MNRCLIKTVEYGALLGLHELKRASLKDNLLQTLPSFIVLLPNLEEANFQSNRINSLQIQDVSNATMTNTYFDLNLRENHVTEITNSDFLPFESVHYLAVDLSENQISKIATEAFRPIKRFVSFGIGKNSIGDVIFTRLRHTQIETLDLSYCQINISELNSSVLRPLSNSNVRELRLSGNRISAIASDVFQSLPVIEKLDLSSSKIATMQRNFKTMSSTLRELDISINLFSDLELFKSVTLSFPKLQKLVARHNEFVTVNTVIFPPHQHLKVLDLSYNRLYGYLNFTLLTNLRELYLNGLFGILPYPYTHPGLHLLIVQNMTSLVKLQYTHNKACVLRHHMNTSVFEGLSTIREIDLTGNSLFCMMKNEIFPHIFKSQCPVRKLILASNSISKLPKNVFSNLPHLQHLDLSDNNMENVGAVFDSLTSLVFLNLRKNKLVNFDITAVLRMNQLHHLNIELNRFVCSCDSSSFSKWLRHTTTYVNGARQKCSEPAEYQNTALEDFNPPWITCGNHLITVVFCCIGAGVVVIGAVAGLVAYFRLDIVYWWHLKRLNRRRHGYIRCGDGQVQYEYDAFVAHSSRDEEWVVRQFLPHVEGQGQGRRIAQGHYQGQGNDQGQDIVFNVCIHSRNFLPGDYIIDSIVEKMEASKVGILIISQHFLESDWCRYEVDIAQAKVLRERRKSLIVVFLEKIPPDQLPKTLRLMKRHVTYLEWPEEENDGKKEEFWKKLKLALLKKTRQIDEALNIEEEQV
ncbi:toll-like receptor 13 [Lingula anatina]|uniref:Toll-like receptor 13 n=1 Tax=Lingula anatina TaxID=7574 RepID=A0A1S3IRE8_LINAN|nr:toll-like receptor 13 [Lingula anatina]|eukprot:XP_013400782.1 toll-like receptor 13 [Lingula anatina]